MMILMHLQLVDSAAQHTVAKAHSAHSFFSTQKMSVDFDPALVPILDILVLSFIICEEKRRQQQRTAAASIAVSTGTSC